MSLKRLSGILTLALAAVLFAGAPAGAQVLIQCPCDMNSDGDCEDIKTTGPPSERWDEPDLATTLGVQCMHLSASDGFATMADGRVQYIFSFADMTGTPEADVMNDGILAAEWPAPGIMIDEGQEFYLTLSNVGMLIRPDLFDPHTVHFHGFPQSSTVFDGLPESGLSINMGASLTYYYNLQDPGTYMYHCHVEATEHMQMGMLGNLYVRPLQNGTPLGVCAGGAPCTQFVYNDGDGSTGYDVEKALQLGSFDPEFHDASWFVQPLPFAMMYDTYPMINGRGYPDTINPGPLPSPTDIDNCGGSCNNGIQSQLESSLVVATAGDRVLLRLSNLNITDTHTLISPSIQMQVVGIDAKQLLSDDGSEKLYYTTNSVTISGGMSADVILDTAGVAPGDYYLYASNLKYLANNDEPGMELGGMMTKIIIN
jgi:FtsP/CotA-like multicopper oxidase with cupredoxin domain